MVDKRPESVQGRRWPLAPRRGLMWLLALGVLAPAIIAVVWGDVYADAAYQHFQQARSVARDLDPTPSGFTLTFERDAPLHTLLLALIIRSPWSLPTVALMLSVLGWMATITTWFWTGLALDRPTFSVAIIVLLALHPFQPQVMGLETGPVLGLMGLATLLAVRGKSSAMLIVMILLGVTQPAMLPFVVPLLFFVRIWRHSGATLTHVAASVLVGALGYAVLGLIVGTCGELRQTAVLLAAMQLTAAAVFALMVPSLDWLVQPAADRSALRRAMVSLALIVLVLWQGNTLVSHWRMRPTDRLALYKRMAQWVREHTLPTETVGASQAGLMGYLSDRYTLALPASATTQASAILAAVDRARPDYIVALNSLAWRSVRSQPWFQERYQRAFQLASPYDVATPLTVFRYTPSPFDSGAITSVMARFTPDTEEWIELTSYRLDRQRITPGEPLHLTLNWRAATAVHQPLFSVVRLIDPTTGKIRSHANNLTPGGLETEFWNAEARLTDHYTLVPPVDLPPGDYSLDVALYSRSDATVPVLAGVQGDALRREPVILSQTYQPPAVSTAPLTPDHPLEFAFGEEIELVGYDVSERVTPGDRLRVALYWHALQSVPLDYKVFVHLFAPDGQLLAQHDSPPINWSYPTTRWLPGETIRDEHVLIIDPSAPRGDYVLSAGLYDTATGKRAVVRDASGNEISEQRVVLQQIQVR
jgi:hypothetical protein